MADFDEDIIGENLDYEEDFEEIDEDEEEALLAGNSDALTVRQSVDDTSFLEEQDFEENVESITKPSEQIQNAFVAESDSQETQYLDNYVQSVEEQEPYEAKSEVVEEVEEEEEVEDEDELDECEPRSDRDRFKSERTISLAGIKRTRTIPDSLDQVKTEESIVDSKRQPFKRNKSNNRKKRGMQRSNFMNQNQHRPNFINQNQQRLNMNMRMPVPLSPWAPNMGPPQTSYPGGVPFWTDGPFPDIRFQQNQMSPTIRPMEWNQGIRSPRFTNRIQRPINNANNNPAKKRRQNDGPSNPVKIVKPNLNEKNKNKFQNAGNKNATNSIVKIQKPIASALSTQTNPNLTAIKTVNTNEGKTIPSIVTTQQTDGNDLSSEEIEYRKKLEEQKKKREEILAKKELRRKAAAALNAPPKVEEEKAVQQSPIAKAGGPMRTQKFRKHQNQRPVKPIQPFAFQSIVPQNPPFLQLNTSMPPPMISPQSSLSLPVSSMNNIQNKPLNVPLFNVPPPIPLNRPPPRLPILSTPPPHILPPTNIPPPLLQRPPIRTQFNVPPPIDLPSRDFSQKSPYLLERAEAYDKLSDSIKKPTRMIRKDLKARLGAQPGMKIQRVSPATEVLNWGTFPTKYTKTAHLQESFLTPVPQHREQGLMTNTDNVQRVKRFKRVTRRKKNGEIIMIKQILLDASGNPTGREIIEFANEALLTESEKSMYVPKKLVKTPMKIVNTPSRKTVVNDNNIEPNVVDVMRSHRPFQQGSHQSLQSHNITQRQPFFDEGIKTLSSEFLDQRNSDRRVVRVAAPKRFMSPVETSCTVKLSNLPATISVPELRRTIRSIGFDTPMSVEYDQLTHTCVVVFANPNVAEEFCRKMDGFVLKLSFIKAHRV